MYAENVTVHPPMVCADQDDITTYLSDKDILLVPESYDKLLGAQAVAAIHGFRGNVIPCYYEMDEGSLLYLETKIKRLLDQKSI